MSRYKQPLRPWLSTVLVIKYLGLLTLNIVIFTFFYKINKGDLPLMYSYVFWSEFINLDGFFGSYCLTLVTFFIIRSKGSTEKQPSVRNLVYSKAVCGPKTHRIADFFRPDANFYHHCTVVNV